MLARLFTKETGMTFTHWRDHLRVMTAVDRLARGHNVTAIALELGYQSANNFSTMFSRLLGAPPKRYMRLLLNRREKNKVIKIMVAASVFSYYILPGMTITFTARSHYLFIVIK